MIEQTSILYNITIYIARCTVKKFNHEISTEIFYKVHSSTENTVLEEDLKIAICLSFKERQLYKLDFYQCWLARIIAVIKPTVIM